MNIIRIQWLRPIIVLMTMENQEFRKFSNDLDTTKSLFRHPLTNDDFRKLLMTPAAPGASSSQRFHGPTPSPAQQKTSSGQKFVLFSFSIQFNLTFIQK